MIEIKKANELRAISDEKNNVWEEYNKIIALLKEAAESGGYSITYHIKGEMDCGFEHKATQPRLIEEGFLIRWNGRSNGVNEYYISFR